ncbi:MAG: polysaccharide deacetylase family protein [Candidatus Omnitrophota bacterium]
MKKKNSVILVLLVIMLVVFLWGREQYAVPIIMYHNIDQNSASSRLSVSPENFERQMSFLKRNDYNVVELSKISDLIRNNEVPYKTIAITFDDGYENNYKYAFPILKKYGLPATIFIAPGVIGKEGYMTWEQVIEMSDSDVVSIGSHSMNHAYLPHIQKYYLDLEIKGSKDLIERYIKKKVYSFSYPVGGFNDYVRNLVVRAGYKIAVATNPGKKYPKHDIFAMKRLRISNTSDNLFVFWIETSGFYTWIKEHRDDD